MASPTTGHHILTVTVENKPGVLSRVAGLFSRRAFNIFSLAVSPTEDERFSRMTLLAPDADTTVSTLPNGVRETRDERDVADVPLVVIRQYAQAVAERFASEVTADTQGKGLPVLK